MVAGPFLRYSLERKLVPDPGQRIITPYIDGELIENNGGPFLTEDRTKKVKNTKTGPKDVIFGYSVLGVGMLIMVVGLFLTVLGLVWFNGASNSGHSDQGVTPQDTCLLISGVIFVATAALCLIIFKEKREKWIKEDTEHCWRCGELLEPEERFCFICGEERPANSDEEVSSKISGEDKGSGASLSGGDYEDGGDVFEDGSGNDVDVLTKEP